jgi:polysaccharide export outer membrane protein
MRCARTLIWVILSILAIVLTGCFSSRPKDIEAFLKPYETNVSTKSYALQPPDEIEIHCSKVPEIHLQHQQIRPDGKVSFEGLGEIEAAGKTPQEVADILHSKALELYTLAGDKPIEVRVVAYRSKSYYVLGEVADPGPKVYTGRDTAFSAIAEALPTVLAWEEHCQVIRPSSNKNEKPKIFELNFRNTMVKGDASKDVLLQEGDIVYVPPTILAAIAQVVEEFVRPIGSAFSTVYVVQRVGTGGGERGGY